MQLPSYFLSKRQSMITWLLLFAAAGGIWGYIVWYFRRIIINLPTDLKFAYLFLFFKWNIYMKTRGEWTIADLFLRQSQKTPNAIALMYEGRQLTFKDVDIMSNKIANWARGKGIGRRSVVALVMENRPEYIVIWLGMTKLGAITALINSNLSGQPLHQALKTALESTSCGKKLVIIGSECASKVTSPDAADALSSMGAEICIFGEPVPETGYFDPLLHDQSDAPIPASCRKGLTAYDTLFYIYTSGTTGMPKAATIPHIRFFIAGYAFANLYGIMSSDRIYCTLPIYHSAGGMIGTGMSWIKGATLVLRRKFSASNFWNDCRLYQCTVIQYIGELCRYLIAQSLDIKDKDHRVRIAIGNGLRRDTWIAFQDRFNVSVIGEFYASTEGNTNLFNISNKPGACGYLSPIMQLFYPIRIVKFDVDNEHLVRDKHNNYCIDCDNYEPGEVLGKIRQNDVTRRFDGYSDPIATEKKIARHVFDSSDAWFRSGDLLERDADGYVYFVDRIGDTFRWKGENVATNQIAEVIGSFTGIIDVTVYGVRIPKCEGRAGMAYLVVNKLQWDTDSFYRHVCKELPPYARPLFLRLGAVIQTTTTFKHKKIDLVREGYDPLSVGDDEIWMMDNKANRFRRVDRELYRQVMDGVIPL